MDRSDLAAAVGVHEGTVSRWETGGASPTPYNIDKLATALRVEPGVLRGELPLVLDELPAADRLEDSKSIHEAPLGTGNMRAILEQILRKAVSAEPWLQLEILREVAALTRANAAEHDSRAAELRAEAATIEARAYERRSDSLAAEAEGATTRSLIAEAVRTGRIPPELFKGFTAPARETSGSAR